MFGYISIKVFQDKCKKKNFLMNCRTVYCILAANGIHFHHNTYSVDIFQYFPSFMIINHWDFYDFFFMFFPSPFSDADPAQTWPICKGKTIAGYIAHTTHTVNTTSLTGVRIFVVVVIYQNLIRYIYKYGDRHRVVCSGKTTKETPASCW